MPTHTFDDAPKDLEVLIIPGGLGNRNDENVKPVVNYLTSLGLSTSSQQHLRGDIKWILTVCTGSEILARTGALDEKRATTNTQSDGERYELAINVIQYARQALTKFSSTIYGLM